MARIWNASTRIQTSHGTHLKYVMSQVQLKSIHTYPQSCYMSRGNESVTNTRGMAHIWNASCHTYKRIMALIWNASCHTYNSRAFTSAPNAVSACTTSVCPPVSHTHTRAHTTHTHTNTTQTHTHTTHTHKHMYTCTHVHMHTCTHAHKYTYIQWDLSTHPSTTHTRAHTPQPRTHLVHMYTRKHTSHAYTHTHSKDHTHTSHTHTHVHM